MGNKRPALPTKNIIPQNFPKFARLANPDIISMAGNLVESSKKIIETYKESGQILATEENANKRLEICSICSFYNKDSSRCLKCGCFMIAKTKLQAMVCPIGKW